MTEYEVTFRIQVPVAASEDDLLAFLKFELGEVASLDGKNALANIDLRSCEVDGVFVR